MAERREGSSTALSEAELVFEQWIECPDRGDLEDLCADRPELADELRRMQAGYERAREALGALGDPRGLLGEVLERLGHPEAPPSYADRGEVARGGMGVIRSVWDEQLRRTLAMKVLSLERRGGSAARHRIERFLAEARIAGGLQHPGVAPVHTVGLSDDGELYFTMPLIEGDDLRPIIERLHAGDEEWTLSRVLGVLVSVCETMAYAHARGVVHRDLKPANVMVGRFGEVRVMDWGLAKVLGEPDVTDIRPSEDVPEEGSGTLRTMDGDVLGTPGYMSPEQAHGRLAEVGVASDVYSLGCMLYHVLTGRTPYAGSGPRSRRPLEVLSAVRAGPPEAVERVAPDVPLELVAICGRAMAREPRGRYADVGELARDVRAWLEGHVVRAYEAGAWAELRKWVARNRALAAALAVAAVAAVGGSTAVAVVQARAGDDLRASNKLLTEANYFNSVALAQQAYDSANTANMRSLLDGVDANLRGWEWYYLHRLTDTSLRTLRGHTGDIAEVDWSPAGDQIASAGRDGTLRVWDVTTGDELFALDGHGDLVEDVAYSPDGMLIASAGRDGTARLWHARSGASVAVFRAGEGQLEAVAFAPDGAHIATGGEDALVRLWDVAEPGAPLARLEGHLGQITTMQYSPDGRLLASGSHDGTVRLWDLGTGTTRFVLRAERTGSLRNLSFTPDGRTLFASSLDRDVIAWNVEDGTQRQRFTNRAASYAAAIGPRGELLATSDFATLRLWDVASERSIGLLCGHDALVRCVAFSPEGNLLVSGSTDRTLRLWDPHRAPARTVVAAAADDLITGITFVGDGELVAWGARDNRVGVADAATGEIVRRYDPGQGWVTAVAFDPRRRSLVSGGADGSVVFRALEGGGETRIEGTGRVWRVVLDGAYLATAHEDGSVRVLDLDAEREVFGAHFEQRVTGLDLGHGRLAVGVYDGRVEVFELDTRRVLLDVDASTDRHPTLVLSPDGRRLAVGSGDRRVRMFDLAKGVELFSAEGHESGVSGLAFTPGGRRLVSSGGDGLVKLWDAASGRPALTLRSEEHWLAGVAVSADGRRLATGDLVGRVFVWDSEE